MLKIFVGFVIFAALAMFVIFKGGDSLDMGNSPWDGKTSVSEIS